MVELKNIKGMAELQKLLDTLPAKLETSIIRGALRAGAKSILETAKQNVPSDTGELRDGLKIVTRKRGGQVQAIIKATGKHAYLANWVEFGTRGHRIPGPLQFNGAMLAGVDHPGARARPFLRPALDQNVNTSISAAGEYIKSRLSKHGLDTSDISIEPDEE
jgi:HK97 gp10 family phage protein